MCVTDHNQCKTNILNKNLYNPMDKIQFPLEIHVHVKLNMIIPPDPQPIYLELVLVRAE